jgi:hypothetical protein
VRSLRCYLVTIWLVLIATPAAAQFGRQQQAEGIQVDQQLTQQYRVGVVVKSFGGPCTGLVGTIPVPMEWPEQQVRVVDEEISEFVQRITYRNMGGLREMVFSIPQLPPGETATAMITFEITRSSIKAPSNPSAFVFPKHVPQDIREYLAYSPGVDCRQTSIRDKAKELTQGSQTVWEGIETMYDWVRDNVTYQNGRFKGATAALKDGNGNKEDLVSLFIALCRAMKVPARTVWVVDHVHAEFYLQDQNGKGYWLPCQVAGTRDFGGISDHRPILQKGENFKLPGKSVAERFVPESLTGRGGHPQVEFTRRLLPAN